MGQAFTQPLDIYNRALQLCRLPRIASVDEMSPNAQEMNFAYDKLRRAELRRNMWSFATRRVALRPIASTTALITPSLYDATYEYRGGAMVLDSAGNTWLNTLDSNTGHTPGDVGSGWAPYFGPMTVTPWNFPAGPASKDSNPYAVAPGVQLGASKGNTSYFAGELVYLPDGKGGAAIFQSQTTLDNADDGPYQVDVWQAGVTYARGQIAFLYQDANGQFVLGDSLLNGVQGLSSTAFQSTIDLNTGNEPDLCEVNSVTPWAVGTTWALNDTVYGSDGQLYRSLVASNLGVDPVADTFFVNWTPLDMWANTWTTVITPTVRAISNSWRLIAGVTSTMVIPYPLTAGPLDNVQTRNAYKLPAGFLREAPLDPRGSTVGWLGAPTWVNQDWVIENGFLLSSNALPMIYRFVADVTDVTTMDDMFCEGLAARMAQSVGPVLQPDRNDVLAAARLAYKEAMTEARTVNAVETGASPTPPDSYLTVRY